MHGLRKEKPHIYLHRILCLGFLCSIAHANACPAFFLMLSLLWLQKLFPPAFPRHSSQQTASKSHLIRQLREPSGHSRGSRLCYYFQDLWVINSSLYSLIISSIMSVCSPHQAKNDTDPYHSTSGDYHHNYLQGEQRIFHSGRNDYNLL